MKTYYWLLALCWVFATGARAQGPPITSDKPIMLGAGSLTAMSLVEIRNLNKGTFSFLPVMLHYLPSSNTLVGIEIPYVGYDLENGESGGNIADIKLMGKYQFLRRDATGKTFRMAAKTIQNLGTGKDLDLMDLSIGTYSGYYGVVAGYESLKYGISNELGYNWVPDGSMDAFQYKLGFGLPLLKPQYPNKQVNLYFEYASIWQTERGGYQLLYAQGLQYATKNVTFDLAFQLPLVNDVFLQNKLKYSILFGSRYTF